MKAKTQKNLKSRTARAHFRPRVVSGGCKRELSRPAGQTFGRRAVYLPRRARRGA